jgi:hypothetical protein
MKKDKFMLLGMLAVVLTLGLVFAGCDPNGGDDPYTGPKSITITDITVISGEAIVRLVRSDDFKMSGVVAEGTGSISNGSVTVVIKKQDQTDWNETGAYCLVLSEAVASDGEAKTFVYTNGLDGGPSAWPKVSITGASTTFSFVKFSKTKGTLGG